MVFRNIMINIELPNFFIDFACTYEKERHKTKKTQTSYKKTKIFQHQK